MIVMLRMAYAHVYTVGQPLPSCIVCDASSARLAFPPPYRYCVASVQICQFVNLLAEALRLGLAQHIGTT